MVNLGVIVFVLVTMFRVQLSMDPESPFYGRSTQRIQELARAVEVELEESHWSKWGEMLEKHAEDWKVDLLLFENRGKQLAGEETTLPRDVEELLTSVGPRRGQAGGEAEIVGGQGHTYRIFRTTTENPKRYWVGVRIPFRTSADMVQVRSTLMIRSTSMTAGGLFLDLGPWVKIGLCMALLSVVLWYPLIRSITQPISKMTEVTEAISHGKFDQVLDESDTSELGRLAGAINRMAGRLDHFVVGQKRFLGDIAHELCSPVARLRMALSILDRKAGPDLKERVMDLEEEAIEMSELINELLSFSKAGVTGGKVELEPVRVFDAASKAIERETREGGDVKLTGDESLMILGTPEFIDRAVGNLVRNSLRYAGRDNPIRVRVQALNGDVYVRVKDEGPGIPEEVIGHVFDPFFRPEESRTRETGGAGLGMAIVRSCVQACGGSVKCRNRTHKGLEVTMKFDKLEQTSRN